MLAQIVGSVDANSAFVLVILFAAFSIPTCIAVAKRRSRRELQMQFEIDQEKLRNEDAQAQRNNDRQREYDLAKIATEKDVQFHRIDQGLIEGTKN